MDILVDAMNLPEHEMRLLMADAAVIKWMNDSVNLTYLRRRQAEYLHSKGWSITKGKNFKCEAIIPPDAFLHLPKEWRIDPKGKELAKWLKERHPYLLLRS